MKVFPSFQALDTQSIRREPNAFVQCRHCGRFFELPVSEKEINKWRCSDELIQVRFPELTAEQRELILSGICGECWNKLFPEDEEA